MALICPDYPPGTPIYYLGPMEDDKPLYGTVDHVTDTHVYAFFPIMQGSRGPMTSSKKRTFCDVPEFLFQPPSGKVYVYITNHEIKYSLTQIDDLELIAIKDWRF